MGCDIHAHTEMKINGQWHHLDSCDIDRNYMLFCRMAGVHGGCGESPTPISEPRGLPDDAAIMTRFLSDEYGVDGHSHSWLTVEEMLSLSDYLKIEDEFGWAFGNGWEVFTDGREDLPAGVEDARLVFWFDN